MAPIVFLKQAIRNFGKYTALPFITGIYPSTTTVPTATTFDIVSTSTAFSIATTIFESSEIITATATVEDTSTSIIPTTTASIPVDSEVKEVGKQTVIGVGDGFKSSLHPRPINHLGTWAYIALAVVLAVVTWVVIYSLYKCCCTVGVVMTPRGTRKQSSLRKLEGDNEEEGIELKELESDEESERKAETPKLQLKTSNGSLGTSLEGYPLLTVPSKVLLKDTRVLFPPGLDAFDIPFATPDKKWRNPKLSPIRGTIIPPEVVMYK